MPIYEYRCKNGHTFEVMQSMADDPVTKCQVCGAPVERVFHPVAIHFKGSGFYTTDYGRSNRGGGASSDPGSKEDSKSDSKSDSKADSKAETASKSEGSGSSSDSDSSSSSSSSGD